MAFDLAASARALAQAGGVLDNRDRRFEPDYADSANPPDALLEGEAELKLHRRDAEDWGVRRPEQTVPEHALTVWDDVRSSPPSTTAEGEVDLERRQL